MFQILLWSLWTYRCGQRTVRLADCGSQSQAVFARSLGHQSLPPTDEGPVDEEMASLAGRPLQLVNLFSCQDRRFLQSNYQFHQALALISSQ
ncbi:hypothetical protein TNCV_1642991 [Trichonephila clavipes]|nr:hypothetical protein TNCV_1642991 [Trichonephila clavipes]